MHTEISIEVITRLMDESIGIADLNEDRLIDKPPTATVGGICNSHIYSCVFCFP